MDALKKRLEEIETAYKALPEAAIAIATKLRADVKRGRGKNARKPGSGISIQVVSEGKQVSVTASNQVHAVGREKTEPETWMDIFGRKVVAAAKGGK